MRTLRASSTSATDSGMDSRPPLGYGHGPTAEARTMAQKPEIKVDKAVVFDSKFDAAVKKSAKAGGEAAVKEKLEEAYVIQLVPTAKLDTKTKQLSATCTWTIYEGGGSKLFARLKQSKAATASGDVNPDKITPANLDDVVGAVAEAEVRGIMKALKQLK